MELKKIKVGDRINVRSSVTRRECCERCEISEGSGTVIYAERSGRRLLKVKFDKGRSIHIVDPRDVLEPVQRQLPGMVS